MPTRNISNPDINCQFHMLHRISLLPADTWRDLLEKQLDRLNQCHGQRGRCLHRTDRFHADWTGKALFNQIDTITVPNLKRKTKLTRFMVLMILNFGLFVTEKRRHSGWFLIIPSQTDYLQIFFDQPFSPAMPKDDKSGIKKVKFLVCEPQVNKYIQFLNLNSTEWNSNYSCNRPLFCT